jgi:hypothetical protein
MINDFAFNSKGILKKGPMEKVLGFDRPLAGGFSGLTAFQAEGCGIAASRR